PGTGTVGSLGFAPELACLFNLFSFPASALGVAGSSGWLFSSVTGPGFCFAFPFKFPRSVFVLTFPGAGLALPRASLEIPEELPRSHLELALTGTRREQR